MALKQVVTASASFENPSQTGSIFAKRGAKAKPIVEFPEPLQTAWEDVNSFREALLLHAARHGDSICYLHRCLVHQGDRVERSTLLQWAAGKKTPTTVKSLGILSRIERRYCLPSGYFKAKLPTISRAPSGHRKLRGLTPSEQRRFAWHLPDDFDQRPARERTEILEWVRTVVVSGATDYRRYQAEASKHRYAIRFPGITGRKPGVHRLPEPEDGGFRDEVECELASAGTDAPSALAGEMAQLIRFGVPRQRQWHRFEVVN